MAVLRTLVGFVKITKKPIFNGFLAFLERLKTNPFIFTSNLKTIKPVTWGR